MDEFYRGLWGKGLSPQAALVAAQATLASARDEDGRPVYVPADWMEWVLTTIGRD